MLYITHRLTSILSTKILFGMSAAGSLLQKNSIVFSPFKYYSTKKACDFEGRRFADPTYDDTFKKLFGEESNKKILISALNSFLSFTGSNAIVNVDINNPMLERPKLIGENPSITGTIDILCTTSKNQKIAVEMQGKKTIYFLTREQEYMAKLISGQVRTGEGQNYHNKVLDTYIIVLAKNNVFTGDTALKDHSIYEIDVAPTVRQTGELYPGNKMHWKFFELKKFEQHADSKNITKNSPLKLQWLDFFLSCARQLDVPVDRDDIIKESYHIMDKMSWEADERTLHWKNIVNRQEGEELLSEEKTKSKIAGKVEGIAEGIKVALKYNMEANLEEDFKLSAKVSSNIKSLPSPRKTVDIISILMSEDTSSQSLFNNNASLHEELLGGNYESVME